MQSDPIWEKCAMSSAPARLKYVLASSMSFLVTVMVIYFSCTMEFASAALPESISSYSFLYTSRLSPFMPIRTFLLKSALFSLRLFIVSFVTAVLSSALSISEYPKNIAFLSSEDAT